MPLPPNATMTKFGYPGSCIHETEHWVVLVRPQQATLGALVLACREPVLALSEISAAAFAELKPLTERIEAALKAEFTWDRINYLALMMVDPDVHFHVLPRYAADRSFGGRTFTDPGWPAVPQLGHANAADAATLAALADRLRPYFAR